MHRRIALELARESGGGGDGRRQSGGGGGPAHGPGHRAIDLGQAATDRNLHVASHNPKVATALQRHRWLVMDAFVAQEGPDVLLALVQAAPGDRHFHECVPAGLAVMRIATLYPAAKVATAGVALRAPGDDEHAESSTASSVLLEIASRAAAAQDSDAVLDALHIVCNLVSPPPALAASVHAAAAAVANDATTTPSKPSTKDGGTPTAGRRKSKGGALGGGGNKDAAAGGGLAAIEARMRPARAALREAGGIRGLLSLLLRGTKALPSPNNDAARALCCRALLSLARDPSIAQTLQTLQLARRLTEIMRDVQRHGGGGASAAKATADGARARARRRNTLGRTPPATTPRSRAPSPRSPRRSSIASRSSSSRSPRVAPREGAPRRRRATPRRRRFEGSSATPSRRRPKCSTRTRSS